MPAANSITVTALSIINAAAQHLGALAAGEALSNDDQAWCLQNLQVLIDEWNARRPMIYNVNFTQYTLPANIVPVTIGPNGDFNVNQRPQSIDSIGLILQGTPGVELPLNRRDDDWWANNRIKGLTSSLPTDYYYSPDWPLGNIYFWPVPTSSYQVNLESRAILSEYTTVAQSFSMPPGYWAAVQYELAIRVAPSFEREPSQTLVGMWKRALKSVQVNNVSSPRLATDAPSSSGSGRPDYSFLDGLTR